eukprot:TRINITY_DN5334_c0_g1_i2.p1 TRINITY_DN5334_c0_g1~~TRINITY_DN5334_c0_g1_i2.p1  ORF type:complete len:575 (-),score=132.82 TRINITY_DN5334_c0_g1_i2:112-1836(-)
MSTTPAHWTSKDGIHLQSDGTLLTQFQDLVSATWRVKYTRDRKKSDTGGRLPTGARVTNVLRVENHDKFNSYLQYRSVLEGRRGRLEHFPVRTDSLLEQCLDANLNEMYLFHGTNPVAADSIARSGFKLDLAGSAVGTMFGKGIYLAEHCSKSDEYAKEGEGVFTGQCALLVCRAVAGQVYVTPDKGDHSGKVMSGEFDCVCGDRLAAVGTFREMVFFNADAVYVEFIILYSRLYDAKPDETDAVPAPATPAPAVPDATAAVSKDAAKPKAAASAPASARRFRASRLERLAALAAAKKAAATSASAPVDAPAEPTAAAADAPAAPEVAAEVAAGVAAAPAAAAADVEAAAPASARRVRASKLERLAAFAAAKKAAATSASAPADAPAEPTAAADAPAAPEVAAEVAAAPAAAAADVEAAPAALVPTRRFNDHWTGKSWCHPVTGRELSLQGEDAVSFCTDPVFHRDGKQSITFMPRTPGTYVGVALRDDPLGIGSVRFNQHGVVVVNGERVEDAFKYGMKEHVTLELESGALTFIKHGKRGKVVEKAQYHGIADGVHFVVGVGKMKSGKFEIVG